MSYLLGYQKWRKLHESAGYRKIYEQNETLAIRWTMLSRTDTSPFRDWMLREKQGWSQIPKNIVNDSYNIGLWEISLKDALLGNWDKATRLKEVWSNNQGVGTEAIATRDTFVCGEVNLSGDKVSGILDYNPNEDQKVQASGNGLLALIRLNKQLVIEAKSVGKPISEIIKFPGAIVIEFNHAAPSEDTSAKAGKEEKSRYAEYFTIMDSGLAIQSEIIKRFISNSIIPLCANLMYQASTASKKAEDKKRADDAVAALRSKHPESFRVNNENELNINSVTINVPGFSIPAETFDNTPMFNAIISNPTKWGADKTASPDDIIRRYLGGLEPSAGNKVNALTVPDISGILSKDGYLKKCLDKYPIVAKKFILEELSKMDFGTYSEDLTNRFVNIIARLSKSIFVISTQVNSEVYNTIFKQILTVLDIMGGKKSETRSITQQKTAAAKSDATGFKSGE